MGIGLMRCSVVVVELVVEAEVNDEAARWRHQLGSAMSAKTWRFTFETVSDAAPSIG